MAAEEPQEKRPPILAAAFDDEQGLLEALKALEEHNIGRDFIGAFVGEADGYHGDASTLYMLSVLAPRRLHDEIRAVFQACGARAMGDVAEMRLRYDLVPHPGALEHSGMKVPMGLEFPDSHKRRQRE